MIQDRRFTLILLLSLGLLSSCISNKHVTLFQNANLSYNKANEFANADSEYKLQARDVLAIRIKSIDPTAADYLNLQTTESSSSYNGQLSTFMTGFSISDSGYIHLPTLGKIKVGGLTIEEARAFLQRRVNNDELINATVLMHLVSFKISVLGEVQSPGYYHIYNNRGSILDALALSGGFQDYANRKEVMLIRQKENGTEAIKLDLTDAGLLKSPYYFLRPNDSIIVPPMQIKHQRSNLANLNIVGIVFSGISSAIALITFIELLKQDNP